MYIIKSVSHSSSGIVYEKHLKRVLDIIIDMLQLLCSEGYCYFLVYLTIAYYPDTNLQTSFPPHFNSDIGSLVGNADARAMAGL